MLPFFRDSLSFPNFIGCTIQESLAKTLLDRQAVAGLARFFFSILEFARGETTTRATASSPACCILRGPFVLVPDQGNFAPRAEDLF